MSITDELRKEARAIKTFTCMDEQAERLLAIADRIDGEYQKAIRALNSLADTSVLLPVDADGVPIRVGDKVYQVKGGWVYTVKSITFHPNNTTISFECKHGFGCDSAHNVRHYHKPTVEDVMVEFATDWECAQDGEDKTAVLKEYASKLRLVEGDAG